MTALHLVIGLEGAQMPANQVRGIGRWTDGFLRALVDGAGGTPVTLSVTPTLPRPGIVDELAGSVAVVASGTAPRLTGGERALFHVMSPMEALPISTIWPRWARATDVALATTLYDTIPLHRPAEYFVGRPRHLMAARYEIHRQADVVVAISHVTGSEAVELLGARADRVVTVEAGIDPAFVPHPEGRVAARSTLAPFGIDGPYVLAVGNVDPRKNLEALIDAVGRVPADAWDGRKLVITSSQNDAPHAGAMHDAALRAGVDGRVLLTGFVDDSTLVALYQGCDLMAYVSLSEGLGLPLMEAQACGAAVLTSDREPMRSLVSEPESLCDPSSTDDIAAKLTRLLADPSLAQRLRERASVTARRFRWQDSMPRLFEAYGKAIG